MGKNWLIRTKSNHILGPISKEKILELLQNGSIKSDDEVCSGNGFWFFIREEDMVERFLLGREQQNFNPISEAKDVLTNHTIEGEAEDDITRVGGIDLKRLGDKTPPNGTYVAPFMDTKTPPPEPKKKVELTHSAEKPSKGLPPRPLKPKTPKAPLKNQGYFRYLAVLAFILLLAALWYRKAIVRYFQTADLPTFIETVHAQEMLPAEKKK